MLNLYDYITDSRIFKKFQLDDLLFVEYSTSLPAEPNKLRTKIIPGKARRLPFFISKKRNRR